MAQANLCANVKEWLNNPKTLDSIIEAGREKARTEARKNIQIIRDWVL